jgi:hypothetical protein
MWNTLRKLRLPRWWRGMSTKCIWAHLAPLLDEAMAGLNEADRHAVGLRFLDGKSIREVGAALGANESAARKRVDRALEKLQRYFFKRGVTSTAATLAGAISANAVQAAPAGLATSATTLALAKGAALSPTTPTLITGALRRNGTASSWPVSKCPPPMA